MTPVEPTFAILAAEIRRQLAAQGFNHLLAAELTELRPGFAELAVTRRAELLQQNGFFHGGVTAFLVDNATTIAAATRCKPDQAVLTAEYKLNLISPAVGARLVCRATLVKPGRLSVVEAKVYSIDGATETLSAVALATIAQVPVAKVA